MNARIGTMIGLAFALAWLGVGASDLTGPGQVVVGLGGMAALLAIGWRAWRQPAKGGRFDRKWYSAAVIGELAGMFAGSYVLGRFGLIAYVWPLIGCIVGLHFIGLWRAADDRRFLWLAGGMTTINLLALAAGPWMETVSGLGSSAAIALAVAV